MACITKPISNPLSLPNMCLIYLPSSSPSSIISLPSSKPTTKLSLSLSLLSRKTHFSKLVVHVSDWSSSQQEDRTATVAPEPEEAVFSWAGESGADVDEREGVEDTYVEPPEEAKLFVGNLPYDVDSGKLAELFGQAGVVEIAEVFCKHLSLYAQNVHSNKPIVLKANSIIVSVALCLIHGVDSGKLAELFGPAGVAEIAEVIYNRETDQSRGFGFVTMSTVEQAEKAVEMLHQYDVNGRFLTVNKASPRGARPERTPRVFEPSYRLYVGNLPWDVDDSRLEQVFSEHGKVVNARVVYDRETGRSRGFGFITMESESELNDAISNLDGQDLGGRAIKVNVAEERARRPY